MPICFDIRFWLHVGIRRLALGWPLAISQEEHLSYGVGSPFYARRLGDFVESSVFRYICFYTQLPASGGIASRNAASGKLVLEPKIILIGQNQRPSKTKVTQATKHDTFQHFLLSGQKKFLPL